jgi:hypothetical protein
MLIWEKVSGFKLPSCKSLLLVGVVQAWPWMHAWQWRACRFVLVYIAFAKHMIPINTFELIIEVHRLVW